VIGIENDNTVSPDTDPEQHISQVALWIRGDNGIVICRCVHSYIGHLGLHHSGVCQMLPTPDSDTTRVMLQD
jgi:hypothetical protein